MTGDKRIHNSPWQGGIAVLLLILAIIAVPAVALGGTDLTSNTTEPIAGVPGETPQGPGEEGTTLPEPTPTETAEDEVTPAAAGQLPYYASISASEPGPLPAPRHIFFEVANDAGVKYNLDGAAFDGPNGTYYIKADGGGLNELRITNDVDTPLGQVTVSNDQSGVFWLTNNGGRGFYDDVILLVSVNGTLPDDFALHIKSSGYTWTPPSNATALPTDYTYVEGAVDETFTKEDFIYGPQTWKPGPGDLVVPSLPLYYGQDINDTTAAAYLMFIDLNVGHMYPGSFTDATLTNNGGAKIEFTFTNLTSTAAFNGYGWCLAASSGEGISWTNRVTGTNSSSYLVTGVSSAPVADFTANVTSGDAPLAVAFTDASTGTVTSWAWDFENDGVVDSTEQNPTFTYTTAGTYTVNLTVANDGGSDSEVRTDYITANAVAPIANFTASATSGTVPFFVRFTDLSANSPTSWAWDFGDGATSTDQNATHTYMAAGTYSVNLTVTNTAGSDSEVKQDLITVGETPFGKGLADTAWPKFAYDLRNTGQSPNLGPQTGTLQWTYQMAKTIYSQPAIGSDGTVYMECLDYNLTAINPDGTHKWTFTAGSAIYGTPAIGADGTLYMGCNDRNLYAVNPDGTLKWNCTLQNRITYSSPTIGPDGTIYIGSNGVNVGENLVAISDEGTHGTIKWTFDTVSDTAGIPAIGADGTIYAGSGDTNLYAVHPDGTLKWKYTTGGKMTDNSPSIGADGTIYIGSKDNKLYAINPDGTLKWTYTFGSYIKYAVAIGSDGTIYAGNHDKHLYAINPDGTLKWDFATEGNVDITPAIGSDGTIYIGSYDKKVYAVNPDGTLKWMNDLKSGVRSSPAIGPDGTLYLGGMNNKVYAFKDAVTLPVANFTANTTSGDAPLAVAFTDASAGSLTSWAWDFENDGTIDSTEQNPTHTYITPGTYTVNLTVANAGGSDSMVKTDYITVTEPPGPRTWTVGASGCDFVTLADALGSSSVVEGDTVFVYNGTYAITGGAIKPVSITGEGADVVTLNLGGDRWYVSGIGTVIEKVRFTSGELYFSSSGGISVPPTNVTVRNCIFEDMKNPGTAAGSVFLGLTNNTLIDNTFRNNNVYNLIYMASGTGSRIENNTFTNTTSTATLRGVIRMAACGDAVICNNSFSDNDMPCILIQSQIKTGNKIYLNDFIVPDGIAPVKLQGPAGAAFPWVTPQEISYTYQGSSYTKVLGNYWNTYEGTDADGDGIGDTPYSLVTNQIDEVPLMDRTQFYFGATHTVASIMVSPATANLAVAGTQQFTATAFDTDGLTVPGQTYAWTVSDETVGTIDQTGLFTATGPGTATITAACGAISNTSTVTVTPLAPIANFSATPTSGDAPLAVAFTDASTGTVASWAWDFENNGIVDSTEQNPNHTYTTAGTYTVNLTVTNAGGSDSMVKTDYITVAEPYVPQPASIVVTPTTAELAVGATQAFAATVYDTDGGVVDDVTVAWTSSNGTVGTLNTAGLFTAVAPGTTTVTAAYANVAGTATVTVTRPQGDQTQDTPLDIPGCNVTQTGNGTTEVTINTTATNATVSGNTIRIEEGNFTLTIETEGAPTVGNGTVNGTVAGITLDTNPVVTELGSVGTVSASVSANLTGIPQGAGLTTTVSQNVSADAQSAFQLAASADGLALGDVAYTLNIVKTNLENGQDVAGATIRMAVSPAWVAAHGGVDAIRIIRSAEDGTKEVLATRLIGTDADGNMIFEAVSPNGLSIFGLAAATAPSTSPTTSTSSSGGSSGTSTAVGAASNLKSGESVTLAMDATAVSAVTLTTKTDVRDVMVTVAKGSLPQGAEPPAGAVYQYVQATLYKAAEADMSAVQFRFAVPAAWLAEQGCTGEQVALFRYADGAWQAVPVEALGEGDGNVVFSASPDGFGLFAVATTEQVPGAAGEATPEPTSSVTPTGTKEGVASAEGVPATPQATPLPVWATILAFGFLLFVRRT